MGRPLLPPRGVFAPTRLLFDRELSPVVRDTALQLRALAWGQDETPALSMAELQEATGKSRSALYEHMLLLRSRDALRWRPAGEKTLICSFPAEFWQSGNPDESRNLDLPVKSLESLDSPKKNKRRISQESNTAESGNPDESRNPDSRPNGKCKTGEIQAAYERLAKFKVQDWKNGEATAAKDIARGFTVAQFEEVYRHFKGQAFWRGKRLTLRYLVQQMPAYFADLAPPADELATDEQVRARYYELNPHKRPKGAT